MSKFDRETYAGNQRISADQPRSPVQLYIFVNVFMSAAAQVRLTPRISDGLTFSQGQTMNVRVPVVGQPVPTVTWIKDGAELLTEAGRREVWLEDSCAVLNITHCRRTTDRGVYGIRVENNLGIDEATFAVEITGELSHHRLRVPYLSLTVNSRPRSEASDGAVLTVCIDSIDSRR